MNGIEKFRLLKAVAQEMRDGLKDFCEKSCPTNFSFDHAGSDYEKACIIEANCGDECKVRMFLEEMIGKEMEQG